MFMVAWYSVADSLVQFESVTGDPDLIRIHIHCGLDTLAIRSPIHEMIRRFVPVRAVKTRRYFGSETASFHVSVLYFLIEYFSIISRECSLFIYLLSISILLHVSAFNLF